MGYDFYTIREWFRLEFKKLKWCVIDQNAEHGLLSELERYLFVDYDVQRTEQKYKIELNY